MAPPIPPWYQHEISITAPSRGCHLITSQMIHYCERSRVSRIGGFSVMVIPSKVKNAILDDISAIKIGMANLFIQHTLASLTIQTFTDDDRVVNNAIRNDLSTIKIGMANLFIQHTSASLTINENADPDVRRDMEVALNKIVPAQWTKDGTFRHTMEGEDDMPGHVKSSLMGPSLNIPIKNGRLALGTWQGIYLNEHRDQGGWGGGHTRNIVITLQGQS
eukprot:CCRYP_013928-RB/>CCRYP_013928-RB protein AED:0.21 eAED:0.21 QI:0/0.5/0.2/1/0.75/0.8/5/330/218